MFSAKPIYYEKCLKAKVNFADALRQTFWCGVGGGRPRKGNIARGGVGATPQKLVALLDGSLAGKCTSETQ